MYGIIDIGSNTIRLSVYRMKEDGGIKNVFNKKSTTGLAGYIDEDGNLTETGIQEAIYVLRDFKNIAESVELTGLYAFATASIRNVVNTKEAVEAIEAACGLKINVLSGEEEAECDFIGANYRMKLDTGILVDIGGGSTELVFYKNQKIEKAFSFPIGALNMYKQYVEKVFPTKDEMEQIEKHMVRYLAKLERPKYACKELCGVGGSVRAGLKLHNIWNDLDKNRSMDSRDVKKILKYYLKEPKKAMTEIVQLIPDRAHTILPGLCILNAILKYFEVETIQVSSYGVREGYYLSRVVKAVGEQSRI